jgi:pilus assembly protein CpaF
MEGEVISMQDIFVFRKTGINEDKKVVGQFEATGIRPKFADRLQVSGIEISSALFREGMVV